MIRSALILGAVSFLYMLVGSVTQTLCAPFLSILLGLAAGVLAVGFDKPTVQSKALVSGGLAGLLASVGAVAGTVAGLALRIFVIFTPETFVQIIPQTPGVTYTQSDINTGLFVVFCCCVTSVLFLMTGTGALGGFLAFLYRSRKSSGSPRPAV